MIHDVTVTMDDVQHLCNGPETRATVFLDPEKYHLKVGNLEVIGGEKPHHTKVLIDGKTVHARKLILHAEVGRLTTIELEYYPALEVKHVTKN